MHFRQTWFAFGRKVVPDSQGKVSERKFQLSLIPLYWDTTTGNTVELNRIPSGSGFKPRIRVLACISQSPAEENLSISH